MKAFVSYLVLIGLFVAGAKLVNHQQHYTRSMQASPPAEPAPFVSLLAAREPKKQPVQPGLHQTDNTAGDSFRYTSLTTNIGFDKARKLGSDESANGQKKGNRNRR